MVLNISAYLHIPRVLMDIFSYLTNCLVSLVSLFLPSSYAKNLNIFFKTFPRDVRAAYGGIGIIIESWYHKTTNQTLLTQFSKTVKKFPSKTCFYFQNDVWTFAELDECSNKIANLFHAAGFQKGDVIALMMTNRPEYVCVWLGLAKIGIVTALINTNLRSRSLIHSIEIAKCKAVIFSDDFTTAIQDVRSSLNSKLKFYQWGGDVTDPGIEKLQELLLSIHRKQPPPLVKINHHDHLVYIYTSGTTGLPKAAIMPHSRLLALGLLIKYVLRLKAEDIVYDPLPLYHTAGGMLGIGTSLLIGSAAVLRTKFSASAYISDCVKYKCTVGQYIGEICRYVLAVAPKPEDKTHSLRAIVGNGLRPVIWTKFIERFGIDNVLEVYGSTEGNLQFVNTDGKVGAVGFIPRFLPFSRYIGVIVKVDLETDDIIRNKEGFCIPCEIGEPGMFIGVIPWKNSVKEVHGYLDKKESSKKMIHNVFKKGDRAFVSGDLMVMDDMGYLYFKDRTGDTFRWKGENVSTSEVEAVISSIIGLKDCTVYGVEVRNQEGRIGMVSIVDTKNEVDLENLAKKLDQQLPKYAHPVFVRIVQEVEMTGTFKMKKFNLQHQGFDPDVVKDPLFFRRGVGYVPLTKQLYDDILSGVLHL